MWRLVPLFWGIVLAAEAGAEPSQPTRRSFAEMSVHDVFQMDHGSSHVVLLRERSTGGRFLPIWIGESEALAISLRLARQRAPRPLTHDLLERMVSAMGGRVTKIQIEELRDATFLGRVYFRSNGRVSSVDARPSDSIALALGAGVPIFAARKVLEQAGIDARALDSDSGSDEPQPRLEELLKRRRAKKRTSI